VTGAKLELEAIGSLEVARNSGASGPNGGVLPEGAPKNYLLRWDGVYFGFRSEGDPFLVIEQGIALNGEINFCDMLVVEGHVQATMKECREIKITETGTFKGTVEFERADISGVFEGDLTAREHLVVRATGRVTGTVSFGELQIERGGQVIGDIQVYGTGAGRLTQGAGDKLAK
jgi:cytoskeletal protein CcmA (bactofilin family)